MLWETPSPPLIIRLHLQPAEAQSVGCCDEYIAHLQQLCQKPCTCSRILFVNSYPAFNIMQLHTLLPNCKSFRCSPRWAFSGRFPTRQDCSLPCPGTIGCPSPGLWCKSAIRCSTEASSLSGSPPLPLLPCACPSTTHCRQIIFQHVSEINKICEGPQQFKPYP